MSCFFLERTSSCFFFSLFLADDDELEDVESLFVYALDMDDGSVLWSVTSELGSLVRLRFFFFIFVGSCRDGVNNEEIHTSSW